MQRYGDLRTPKRLTNFFPPATHWTLDGVNLIIKSFDNETVVSHLNKMHNQPIPLHAG